MRCDRDGGKDRRPDVVGNAGRDPSGSRALGAPLPGEWVGRPAPA